MKKMKKMKFLASFLAVLMVLMSFTTMMASAANTEEKTATITIKNDPSTTGTSIQGISFSLYKVFDLAVSYETDVTESIEYTIDVDFYDFFADKLGISLADYTTQYKAANDGATDANAKAAYQNEALEYINSFKTYTENGDVESNTMSTLVVYLMEYIEDKTVTPEDTTGSSPTVVADVQYTTSAEVDYGYYLVIDSDATAATGGIVPAGSLVTVPGRTDGILYDDVTIDMKGSMPDINKEVWHNDITNTDADVSPTYGTSGSWDTVADYQIGDIIEYRITATVPNDLRGYSSDTYTYIVTDTLSSGIEFVDGSLGIYTSANLDSTTNMVSSELHKITYDTDGYTFQIDFDMYSISQLEAFSGYHTFYIYYKGIVTEDAVIANNYESNTVSLKYSNNPYDESSTGTITDTVYSYTFDLDILKTAGDGTTPLGDAQFALYEVTYSGGDQVLTQIYLTLDTDTENYETAPQIYYTTLAAASSTAGIITTNASGEFDIRGLDDQTTYMLKEISAPEGYNVADPVTFMITASYSDVDGVPTPTLSASDTSLATSGSGLYGTIVNTSNQLLPSTGGAGVVAFYVVGGVIMLAAVIILIAKRKKPPLDSNK